MRPGIRNNPFPETTVAPAAFFGPAFRSTRMMRPLSISTLPVPMCSRFSGETIVTSVIHVRLISSYLAASAQTTTERSNANMQAPTFIMSFPFNTNEAPARARFANLLKKVEVSRKYGHGVEEVPRSLRDHLDAQFRVSL